MTLTLDSRLTSRSLPNLPVFSEFRVENSSSTPRDEFPVQKSQLSGLSTSQSSEKSVVRNSLISTFGVQLQFWTIFHGFFPKESGLSVAPVHRSPQPSRFFRIKTRLISIFSSELSRLYLNKEYLVYLIPFFIIGYPYPYNS